MTYILYTSFIHHTNINVDYNPVFGTIYAQTSIFTLYANITSYTMLLVHHYTYNTELNIGYQAVLILDYGISMYLLAMLG